MREALMDAAASPVRRLRSFGQSSHRGQDAIWALRDVGFEVMPGEVVGVIGSNGAGKSTLLKILSEITYPTEGRVRLRGRVASLLEVGTGFHPELTGRENIFLNGAILGMTRREILDKFGEIVAFAGVETFIDTPVKRYSSGMQVRLAFAVAAHLEPEILLVDEVLAVGDAAFQKKCVGRMGDVARSGRTILFVSHNMAAVEALCSRAVLLREGRLVTAGPTREVVEHYLRSVATASGEVSLTDHPGRRRNTVPMVTSAVLSSGGRAGVSSVRMGCPLDVAVTFQCGAQQLRPVLGLVIRSLVGAPVFTVDNRFIPGYRFPDPVAEGTITCSFEKLPLMPGTYMVDIYFGDETRSRDVILDAVSFDVVASDVFGSGKLPSQWAGPVYWPAAWSLRAADGQPIAPAG
jgi:lipopolysaccharide transport system ATP-binding protein